MILDAVGTPPYKRRRLDIDNVHQVQTTVVQYPPTFLPEREGYDARGVVDDGAQSAITSAGRSACGEHVGQESLECCYGMVRIVNCLRIYVC